MMSALLDLSIATDSTSVSELFSIDQRIGFNVQHNNAAKSTAIDLFDADIIKSTFAFDIGGFSTSSFQTICTASKDFHSDNHIAWSLIRIYYSAFYAAHAIMRMFGRSCSFFERSHIARIQAVGQAVGATLNFRLERGLYYVSIDANKTGLELHKVGGHQSGSHEIFWKIYFDLIKEVRDDVINGPLAPAESQQVFACLTTFIASVKNDGWLSFVRNEIQYRHAYGVWFPSNAQRRNKATLSAWGGLWLLDPMTIAMPDDTAWEVEQFIAVCSFIIAICRCMTRHINSATSLGKRCYTAAGPMKFLQQGQYAGA